MAEKTTTIKNALIENNKLVATKLKALDEKKVDKTLVEDTTSRYKVLSDNNFNDTYKHQLDVMDTTIASDITNAVEKLDVTDIVNDRQYVSGVSEENGKITVTRAEHLGGIINVEDESEISIKVAEAYYSKFLFSDKNGNLHYDSAIAGKVGRMYTLETATALTAVKNNILANLPHSGSIKLIENDLNTTYVHILKDSSSGSDVLFIRKYVGGTMIKEYSSYLNKWVTEDGVTETLPPTILITQNIVDTVVSEGFVIDRILQNATFQDRIILTTADVTDNVDNSTKCVTSRAVKAEIENLQGIIAVLTAKINEIIAAHNSGGSSLDLLAYDESGNVIETIATDETWAAIDVEVIGG